MDPTYMKEDVTVRVSVEGVDDQFNEQLRGDTRATTHVSEITRPLHVDPAAYDQFTIARMTDHNVRGLDDTEQTSETEVDAA